MNSSSIQNAYIDFYTVVRNYIWGFATINKLVDIEIESFQTFPDIIRLRNLLSDIRPDLESTMKDDDELKNAFDSFVKLVESDDKLYSIIDVVREVIQHEDQ